MMHLTRNLLLLLLVAGMARNAHGFALHGPFKTWQVTALGYNLPGDVGGVMLGNEGYRWNVHTIHYAYDQSFLSYFGKPGVAAVDACIQILNELPSFSSITNDEFALYIRGEPVPTDVKGPQNFSFAEAGLLDLKSFAMQGLLSELGLAQPARYTWTLRARDVFMNVTNYSVVKLNYDPVTFAPSSFVNGQLYDYEIVDPLMIRGITYAEAQDIPVNAPFPYAFNAVAEFVLGPGEYFFALSQDDVGGLRFLYNKNNFAVEPLVPGITGSAVSSSPWSPYVGTNVTTTTNVIGTNVVGNLIVTGIRPGVNKLRFKKVKYDSLVGQLFTPVINSYTDTVITNSRVVRQSVQRGLTQPDLLFVAEDCGIIFYIPVSGLRTVTSAWQNNDALNGNDGTAGDQLGGPGVITPQIRLSFSDQFPYWLNFSPDFLTGGDDTPASAVWGSFDENTEVPVIYPLWLNLTLQDLQRLGQ